MIVMDDQVRLIKTRVQFGDQNREIKRVIPFRSALSDLRELRR